MKRFLSVSMGFLLLLAVVFGLQTKKASATSLAYTLTVTSNCAVLVGGSATSTGSVVTGETSNVTVGNDDLVVSIGVSGPGVPSGTVLQPNNKASTHNAETFQLGNVTSQQIITFTAIPNPADPFGEGNNCPTGSAPVAGKLVINPIAPTPPTSTTVKPKATTTTPNTDASTPVTTDTVTISEAQVAGKTVATDKSFDVNKNDIIKITGQTVANGLVALTIHSSPKTDTVTADANGKWTYSIEGLDPGSHYIEATVTNPKTSKVSTPVKLLSFNVKSLSGVTSGASTVKPIKKSHVATITAILIALIAVAAGAYIFWRRKKSAAAKPKPTITEPEKDQTGVDKPDTE